MAAPDESPERYDLGYLLARASQRWDGLLTERCRAHGFPEVRPAGRNPVLIDRYLRDAVEVGLVTRQRDSRDGRASRIWLTERAQEFRPVADRILAEMDAALSELLSARSQATLRRSLQAVKDLPIPGA